jgi:hypothetical protein
VIDGNHYRWLDSYWLFESCEAAIEFAKLKEAGGVNHRVIETTSNCIVWPE